MSKNDDITAAIRDARKTKGLSQSELSARIGVPQSHISKIESGAVDLKLSSLVQIARALNLEVKLVPRKALPAVESIVRSTKGSARDRTGDALKEIRKTERILEGVKKIAPSAKLAPSLKRIEKNLQDLKALRYDADDFSQLGKALEQTQKPGDALTSINTVVEAGTNPIFLGKAIRELDRRVDELSMLRNGFFHGSVILRKAPRPAYGFEADEDD